MGSAADTPGAPQERGYRVDDLIIDVDRQCVKRGQQEIALPQLSFDLLLALARNAPRVLTFDELIRRVWAGLVVSPETVSQRVKLVRDALGDDPHAPRYIAGVRGRGYRMLAPVGPLTPETAVAPDPQGFRGWRPQAVEDPFAAPRTGRRKSWKALVAMLAAAALLAGLVELASRMTERNEPPTSLNVRPPQSVAVLPLLDISPGGGNEYLGDGLAEELSNRLARIPGLRVAARTSAFAFKGQPIDVRRIGRSLGVRNIVEGSVRRDGDRLRVTAQLIDTESGYRVWSQSFDRTWQELLVIEDDLARSIVDGLQLALSGDVAERIRHPPTASLAAFDLYLGALAALRQPTSAAQLERAERGFRAAIAADPVFALAHAGLCETFVLAYERDREGTLVPKAEAACGKALSLDSSMSEVKEALGKLYLASGRNEEAGKIFGAAIDHDPGDADAHIGLAAAYEAGQRTPQAEESYRRAIEVEPNYWNGHTALGNFLFHSGRPAEAAEHYRRVTDLAPASALAFNNLGAALEMTGDFEGAAHAFERSLAIEPTRSAYSNTGTVYYYVGRFADAADMFRRAAEMATEDHRVWGNLADALYQMKSGRQEALQVFRRAIVLAERSQRVNASDAVGWAQLGYYYGRVGDAARAGSATERALALGANNVFVHYYASLVALDRDDSTGALSALRRAVELGYPAHLVNAAPEFARLRGDSRFQRLVAAVQ